MLVPCFSAPGRLPSGCRTIYRDAAVAAASLLWKSGLNNREDELPHPEEDLRSGLD